MIGRGEVGAQNFTLSTQSKKWRGGFSVFVAVTTANVAKERTSRKERAS